VFAVDDLVPDARGEVSLSTDAFSFNQQLVNNGLAVTANY